MSVATPQLWQTTVRGQRTSVVECVLQQNASLVQEDLVITRGNGMACGQNPLAASKRKSANTFRRLSIARVLPIIGLVVSGHVGSSGHTRKPTDDACATTRLSPDRLSNWLKRFWLLGWAMLLLASHLLAGPSNQQVEHQDIKTTIEPSTITLGLEAAFLSIGVTVGQTTPTLGELPQADGYKLTSLAASSSTVSNNTSGRLIVVETIRFGVRVDPNREGTLEIPGLPILIGEVTYFSQPVTLQVIPLGSTTSVQAAPTLTVNAPAQATAGEPTPLGYTFHFSAATFAELKELGRSLDRIEIANENLNFGCPARWVPVAEGKERFKIDFGQGNVGATAERAKNGALTLHLQLECLPDPGTLIIPRLALDWGPVAAQENIFSGPPELERLGRAVSEAASIDVIGPARTPPLRADRDAQLVASIAPRVVYAGDPMRLTLHLAGGEAQGTQVLDSLANDPRLAKFGPTKIQSIAGPNPSVAMSLTLDEIGVHTIPALEVAVFSNTDWITQTVRSEPLEIEVVERTEASVQQAESDEGWSDDTRATVLAAFVALLVIALVSSTYRAHVRRRPPVYIWVCAIFAVILVASKNAIVAGVLGDPTGGLAGEFAHANKAANVVGTLYIASALLSLIALSGLVIWLFVRGRRA